jgi:hypothetical protein
MMDLHVPKRDFSTWMGFKVRPSTEYPTSVFIALADNGIVALEASHGCWFWAAKIRIGNFEGKAMSMNRAVARAEAEKKLLTSLACTPHGLLILRALDLFTKINPDLTTGGPKCPSLN